jgi:hypothetical protein
MEAPRLWVTSRQVNSRGSSIYRQDYLSLSDSGARRGAERWLEREDGMYLLVDISVSKGVDKWLR